MENLKKMKNNRFWQNKTVLVTGHEGFLGSWLSKILIEKEARVVGLDKIRSRPYSILNDLRKNVTCIQGDIVNLELVRRVIDKYEPKVIFHLAAEAIVVHANKDPIKTFKSNIEGTWNVIDASRNKKFIEAIIVASSDKAYGSHKKLPYTEDAPLAGSHPYDVSKSCADRLAYAYFNTYCLPVAVTRCGNIYGPGDFHFSRIVPDTMRCALSGKTLYIRSDGKFIRDYIFVEDVVSGYLMLAENMRKLKLGGEAFNFSDENPITVMKLVDKIYKAANKKSNYKILSKAKYEIKHQYLTSRKARKILGWKPAYSLESGLKKTIEWYSLLRIVDAVGT